MGGESGRVLRLRLMRKLAMSSKGKNPWRGGLVEGKPLMGKPEEKKQKRRKISEKKISKKGQPVYGKTCTDQTSSGEAQ